MKKWFTVCLLWLFAIGLAGADSDVLTTRDVQAIKNQSKQQIEGQQSQVIEAKNISDFSKKSAAFLKYQQFSKEVAASQKQVAHLQHQDKPQVMVLVTLSMPKKVLRTVLNQASMMNIPVVIRGFIDNDIAKTAKREKDILTKGLAQPIPSGFEVNPLVFRAYQINHVPAYIATGNIACDVKNQICPDDSFDVVYGTVTPARAMKDIIHSGKVGVTAAKKSLANYQANGGQAP
jgi:conjugal transfer pilus assembly protein TrbC